MKKNILAIGSICVVGVLTFAIGFGFATKVTPAKSEQQVAAVTAQPGGNVQTITSKITSSSYPEITVEKGVPVKWIIQADANDLTGCNNKVIVPSYGVSKKLVAGDNIIEFTPEETGVVPYSCWMGMIESQINVVDAKTSMTTPSIPVTQLVAKPVVNTISKNNDTTSIDAEIAVGGFPELVLESGKTYNINFKVGKDVLNSCNDQILIPEFNVDKKLSVGDNIVTVTTDKEGVYPYSCWMGMVKSKITVFPQGSDAQVGALQMPYSANISKSCPMMGGNNNGSIKKTGGCCGGR